MVEQSVHLQLLKQLAQLFGDKEKCHQLRTTSDVAQLYQLLTGRDATQQPAEPQAQCS